MTILAGVGEKLSNRIGMADYQVAKWGRHQDQPERGGPKLQL
ncbi:Uncharacterised protein [Mycobacterium tuberculosis]|uniref:Uncharacterized protein n=1 Tax=Mycobacterium tuberculosis TaxID=1773 RepID=A0A916LCL8_MYCTX|nr:Uncharacterised protein [Mycobacterium tuberculosis]COY23169.1 Uncharacterised protein [Mycobacterium tuberculosis]COY80123.1 Uncharacterised protein [Mycobacterium tuberculosis]